MKRRLRELVCTCTSARMLLYQSLLVHKPACPLCKALLTETTANVWTQEVLGFIVPIPTVLEDLEGRKSTLPLAPTRILA